MAKEYPVRRRFPRFTLLGKVEGKMIAAHEATVVNLSLGGALVEHSTMVRPGSISQLILPFGRADIRITCRVVRSALIRRETRGREAVVVYQSGLEFLNLSAEALAALDGLIAASRSGGGTPGDTAVTLFPEEPPFPPR